MAWIVGNGKSISIGEDRWVGSEKKSAPASTILEPWKEMKVDSLIVAETGQWNNEVIEQIFEQEDAEKILAMPRPITQVEDQLVWRFTKQGWFSVKSAYHKAIECYSLNAGLRASSSTTPRGWAQIWSVQTIPKIRLFLWRACANALPVRANLVKRGCTDDEMCAMCGDEPETTAHLLMYCREVQPIWYSSPLRIDLRQQQYATFQEFLWTSIERWPPQNIALLSYIAWEIWNARNSIIFEDKRRYFHDVVIKATQRWQDDVQSREEGAPKEKRKKTDQKWCKPSPGTYKLNTDIAVGSDGTVGFGFVLRDHSGSVGLAGKTKSRVTGNSTILEGMAVRYALQMVERYRLKATHIESDNQSIVQLINAAKPTDMYARQVVQDVKWLMERVECKECRYIPRQANMTAHHIAHGPDFISINHNPKHVISVLQMDVTL